MKMKSEAVQPGAFVVFNDLPDATVYEVTERKGVAVWVKQQGTDYAPQRSDVSLCLKPTAQQLRGWGL